MVDSEEKKDARSTIKAPPELVGRLTDEVRRIRKKRGLTKDPPVWTVIEAALDAYDRGGSRETGSRWDRYEKYRDDIEKLYKILSAGNPITATAIRHNLDAFLLIRHPAGDSKIFFPATSQQELEIYAMVDRILHEVGLPQPIRQAFFKCIEEAKLYAAENDKKPLEMPRKNAK